MTQVQKAKQLLYGPSGIGATNVKIFLGTNRDVTAEEIAEQINAVIEELQNAV